FDVAVQVDLRRFDLGAAGHPEVEGRTGRLGNIDNGSRAQFEAALAVRGRPLGDVDDGRLDYVDAAFGCRRTGQHEGLFSLLGEVNAAVRGGGCVGDVDDGRRAQVDAALAVGCRSWSRLQRARRALHPRASEPRALMGFRL